MRRLISATFHYGLGGVAPKVVSFLLLPVFALVLTPEDYGILELAGALTAALTILMRLGLPGAVSRFFYEHDDDAGLRDQITTVQRFLSIAALIVGLAAAVVLWRFGEAILPGLTFHPVIVLVIVTAWLAGFADVQRRLIQVREQSAYAAKLNIVTALSGTVLSLVFAVWLRWGALGVLYANALVALLTFAVAYRYMRRDLMGSFSPALLRNSLVYASGILPSHIIGTLAPLAMRVSVAHVGSLATLGLFGLAVRFVQPLNILVEAFSNAYMPVYFSVRKNGGERGLLRLAEVGAKVWMMTVCAVVVVGLYAPPLIRLMAPDRFHASADLVPILCVGAAAQVLYRLVGPELMYAKRTWMVPVATLVNSLTAVSAAIVLVPTLGPLGIAIAVPAGYVAAAVVAGYASSRMVRIPHRWGVIVLVGLAGACVLLLGNLWDAPVLSRLATSTLLSLCFMGAAGIYWMRSWGRTL